MQWHDGGQVKRALETTFDEILRSRMRDMPLINPRLAVQALDFEPARPFWTGVLITPWFMNLVLLPLESEKWPARRPGEKFRRRFPGGLFEFVAAEEPALGRYAACSLYSPMFAFVGQPAAEATARAALRALFSEAPSPAAPPHAVSRRELLRGAIGRRKNTA